jgi:hypothetical protein
MVLSGITFNLASPCCLGTKMAIEKSIHKPDYVRSKSV